MTLVAPAAMPTHRRFRITTVSQYEAAQERIAELIRFQSGTPEHQELTILLAAVTEYEKRFGATPRRRFETVH